MITYSNKDEAAIASQKLYFHDELGQNLTVDFYKNREERMLDLDKNNEVLKFVKSHLNVFTPTPQYSQSYAQSDRPVYANRGGRYQNNF